MDLSPRKENRTLAVGQTWTSTGFNYVEIVSIDRKIIEYRPFGKSKTRKMFKKAFLKMYSYQQF